MKFKQTKKLAKQFDCCDALKQGDSRGLEESKDQYTSSLNIIDTKLFYIEDTSDYKKDVTI